MTSLGLILWNILAVVTALLVVVYSYFKWTYQYWKKKNVPHFKPKIPFGNLDNPLTIQMSDSVAATYKRARDKGWKYCGLYVQVFPALLVMDLKMLKNILMKDFQHFMDRGMYLNEKDDPIGAHLVALTGSRWSNLRAKLSPIFTSGKLKSMFQTIVDCGLVFEKYVEENIKPEEPLDIKEVLACFTTDVIGSFAFGIDCNSFKEPNSAFRRFGISTFSMTKTRAIQTLFTQNFPEIARTLKMRQIPAHISEFFTKVVEDAVSYRNKNNVVRKDFLQLLMEMRDTKDGQQNGDKVAGDGNSLTMNEIVAQSFVFFIAGFETSSTTMTFALFELARHPEIQERLRDEISTVLARHDGKMTYDSLSEMKYMRQVVDETLRMHPSTQVIGRVCINDYKVPGEDLVIEKGTRVLISIKSLHYDEEYWENPKEFDPERFTEEKKKSMNQYAYMPFGQGPRKCIGGRFAMMQIKIGLTCLLRKFKVTLNKKTKLPIKMVPGAGILTAEGGIWLNLEKI